MPVVSCEIDGLPGYRWGGSGKCYTYQPGDIDAMRSARSRAAAQGSAAYAAGYEGARGSGGDSYDDRTNVSLKRMVKGHNDSFGNDDRSKVTLPMLRQAYLRGLGDPGASAPSGVTPSQRAFGRVRAFLKMLKNLKQDRSPGNGLDRDLLPAGHPLRSEKREAEMEKQEGGPYRYEGHVSLDEANWGMRFVALRHALGEMLHYYMAREIRDDDVAAKYIEDIGSVIDAAKKMPEFGAAAQSSFYMLMSMVAETLRNWEERDANTAGGMMYYSLRSIQDRFERKSSQRAPSPQVAQHGYDEAVEDPSKEQRSDLPAEAFEPAAFYNEDGEFLRSMSKLPHHINTVTDPDSSDSVDVPRLRNALARFDQTDFSDFPAGTKERARAHLEMHAEQVLKSRKESARLSKNMSDAAKVASQIFDYLSEGRRDLVKRARLERLADSIILIADNAGEGECEPISALRAALSKMRS